MPTSQQNPLTSTPNPLATAPEQQSPTSATGSPASKPAGDISQWTIQETEQWLSEFRGISAQTAEMLQAHGADGQHLVEICCGTDANEVLQCVGVDSPIVRRMLISSVTRMVSQLKVGTPTTDVNQKSIKTPDRSPQVLGEKSITMPTLPAPTHNRDLPTSEQWNLFHNDARMWGDDTSELYARSVDHLYHNPGILVEDAVRAMDTVNRDADRKLGMHLYKQCPVGMKKDHLGSRLSYEVDGRSSALQIIKTFGEMINNISNRTGLSAMQQLMKRTPLASISEVGKEATDVEALLETIKYQKQTVNPYMLYSVLDTALKELRKDPKLQEILINPMSKIEEASTSDNYTRWKRAAEADEDNKEEAQHRGREMGTPDREEDSSYQGSSWC